MSFFGLPSLESASSSGTWPGPKNRFAWAVIGSVCQEDVGSICFLVILNLCCVVQLCWQGEVLILVPGPMEEQRWGSGEMEVGSPGGLHTCDRTRWR